MQASEQWISAVVVRARDVAKVAAACCGAPYSWAAEAGQGGSVPKAKHNYTVTQPHQVKRRTLELDRVNLWSNLNLYRRQEEEEEGRWAFHD